MTIYDLDNQYLSQVWSSLELNAMHAEYGIPGEGQDVDSAEGMLWRDIILHELRAKIKVCADCLLHSDRILPCPCDFPGSPYGVGNDDMADGKMPDIMIVAEGPGYCEDLAGLPLVGIYELLASDAIYSKEYDRAFGYFLGATKTKSSERYTCNDYTYPETNPIVISRLNPSVKQIKTAGQRLDNYLRKAHLWRAPWTTLLERRNRMDIDQPTTVAVTNVTKCRSSQEVAGRIENKTPGAKSIKMCRKYLIAEIALIQPKSLILLGNVAANAIYGKNETMHYYVGQGWMDPPEELAAIVGKVRAFYHPAYIMRLEDFKAVADLEKQVVEILKDAASR